ncbi:MAG: hypothetical protein EPO07_07085, partial [Verrucomicrobia bacterium]
SSSPASSQTVNGLVLNAGNSVVAAAPVSGVSLPSVTLGAITENVGGTVEFVGPATIGSAGNVAATVTITTTTTADTGGVIGGMGLGQNGAFATVGLYDWATTNNAASPFTIIGGSQVPGFYQTTGVNTAGNYDVNSGGANTVGNAAGASTLRFNQNASLMVSNTAFTFQNCQGILVTPNCGAHNETVAGVSLEFYRSTSGGQSYGVIWQNNTLGYLVCPIELGHGRQTGQNNGLVQSGPGTVVYSGVNTYELGAYLNGGFSVVTAYTGFGQTNNGYNSVSAVRLNGGTVVGNATFVHSQAGANARPFVLGNNGGGLAATAGNAMTVDGLVSSAADAGPLTIGIAASSANNNTAGLLPGSGAGTANTTPVYATGTVVLSNANSYTGGTILQSGTLNFNGIFALGGANYGGLTFNGGTLQYVASFPGNNGSADLTSIGSAGITLAAGGGTIDLNGNVVTYGGSIGNGGSGSLLVKSSLAGGVLNLQGANSYSGNTTVTNATLVINNASGSATGLGNVLVQNAATLGGTGSVAGSVTVASGGTLMPGGGFYDLGIGNDLTLAAGSKTWMQIQHLPLSNNVVNIADTFTAGGTLIVTNLGGALANGDAFQLFNALNYAGSFSTLTLPALTNGLVWDTTALNTSGLIAVTTVAPPTFDSFTRLADGNFRLGFSGTSGVNYEIRASTNVLAAPYTAWTLLGSGTFNGSAVIYDDLSATNFPQRYYLIRVP